MVAGGGRNGGLPLATSRLGQAQPHIQHPLSLGNIAHLPQLLPTCLEQSTPTCGSRTWAPTMWGTELGLGLLEWSAPAAPSDGNAGKEEGRAGWGGAGSRQEVQACGNGCREKIHWICWGPPLDRLQPLLLSGCVTRTSNGWSRVTPTGAMSPRSLEESEPVKGPLWGVQWGWDRMGWGGECPVVAQAPLCCGIYLIGASLHVSLSSWEGKAGEPPKGSPSCPFDAKRPKGYCWGVEGANCATQAGLGSS